MAAAARVLRGSLFLMSPAAGAKASAAKKAGAAAAAAAVAKKTEAATTKPRLPTGITKPMPVSDEFRRFAGGAPEVARSEAIKLVWTHIKAHGLQVPRVALTIRSPTASSSLLLSIGSRASRLSFRDVLETETNVVSLTSSNASRKRSPRLRVRQHLEAVHRLPLGGTLHRGRGREL